jgi:uncharacterized protein (TIGR02996 family)
MAATKKKKKPTKRRAAASQWVERDVTPTQASVATDAERDRFLAAVLEAPEDEAPRLVYADWLQQRNDPRGEFIAVQCEIARLAQLAKKEQEELGLDYDEGRIFGRTLDERKRVELLRVREDELLKKNKKAWVGRFTGKRTAYGTKERMWVKGSPTKWDFERGFVATVTMSADDFARNAESIFAVEPLRCAHLTGRSFAALVKCAAIGKLRELDLDRTWVKEDGARTLFGVKAKTFASLEVISLRKCGLGGKTTSVIAKVGDPAAFPHLRELYLGDSDLGNLGAQALASAKLLRNVRELHIDRNKIKTPGAMALAESPHLDNLEVLAVWGNPIEAEGLAALRKRFGKRLETGLEEDDD